ncbi:MAG TPA: oligopeptide/dipeptide ABC transporter ATP-binding protein, partial [Steroidobacteraceae bacterium]|nr:oligopeptide/dipeptide ABC transporter ATP-binding protein [Steroidobacteraceae bacterium]
RAPRAPYTRMRLSAASPARAPPAPAGSSGAAPLLALDSLGVDFPVGHGWFRPRARLRALSAVNLELAPGEALAVVGESGCGKSTLARAVLALLRPCAGRVVWLGRSLAELPPRELRRERAGLQMVFQDPLGSLDPRMTVAQIVAEPLRLHAPQLDAAARARASAAILARVGLAAELFGRYPHELSGGQCQRVGIARAMILEPRLLVCAEPVSALDLPTQRQIVELLATLRREAALSLLFVSHNLALVRQLCERVLVLYLGRMMELAPTELLFRQPLHPYTRELLAAEPIPDPLLQPARLAGVVAGEPPSPLSPPSGCVYRTRCPHAIALCAARLPDWDAPAPRRHVACHRWGELG